MSSELPLNLCMKPSVGSHYRTKKRHRNSEEKFSFVADGKEFVFVQSSESDSEEELTGPELLERELQRLESNKKQKTVELPIVRGEQTPEMDAIREQVEAALSGYEASKISSNEDVDPGLISVNISRELEKSFDEDENEIYRGLATLCGALYRLKNSPKQSMLYAMISRRLAESLVALPKAISNETKFLKEF